MKIALIQLNAGPDKKRNIDRALRFILEAIRSKAQFILLPEVFNYRGPLNRARLNAVAEFIPGESILPLMLFARAHRVYILAGSIYEKIKSKTKVFNTSVLIDSAGRIRSRYRKIHLFDAVVDKKVLKESQIFLPGKKPVVAEVGAFQIGMSVCYDLRFPELFRFYAKSGVNVLCVPSVFTKTTGRAHFEILLRARAIENLCYVLAPNQIGRNSQGVLSYGNSMVVDPWGKILARASENREEIIYVDLKSQVILEARRRLPGITAATNFY